MKDFTLDGATSIGEVPARSFNSLKDVSTPILEDMFRETELEIQSVHESEIEVARKKNGNRSIRAALHTRGIDTAKRPAPYLDAGMYLEQRARRA